MAQVSRVYKFEVPVLVRVLHGNYNQQRRGYSYYDILRISPNATQKEIKDAYIKLSKELHPDIGNKGCHADFVKLNEAYSVLSKCGSRSLYDNNLKYYNTDGKNSYQQPGPRQQNYYQQGFYHQQGPHQRYGPYHRYGPYEQYSYKSGQWDSFGRYDWGPVRKATSTEKRRAMVVCVVTVFVGILLQMWHIARWTEFNRQIAIEKSMQAQREYEMVRDESKDRTMEEHIQRYEEWNKKYNYSDDYK